MTYKEMSRDETDVLERNINDHGPTRVVVRPDGYAAHPNFAAKQEIQIDVVFVRNDGWSLGAPEEFEDKARDTWPSKWVAMLRRNKEGRLVVTGKRRTDDKGKK